jgi:DNA helicase IV
MDKLEKESILNKAIQHIQYIQSKVENAIEQIKQIQNKKAKEIRSLSAGDQIMVMRLLSYYKNNEKELSQIYPSPYFVRCEVDYGDAKGNQILYFGKFSFSEEFIYSWITPAATIRFEQPGEVSYIRPDGEVQKGKLVRKDQYMIVNGKIIFLATETLDNPRELIHQEYFSTKKSGFMLPEIVEQMEKAQDQVIRAHHKGPFVISGPAGSGKTTLALHRVAYLVQSPDTNKLYNSNNIIIFVQDNNTKDYFSHLLPELGITDIKITTFFEWAVEILNIKDVSYVSRFGSTEKEKDNYEYHKKLALDNIKDLAYSENIYDLLAKFYADNSFVSDIFTKQRKEKLLDRFDLTILLKIYIQTHGQPTINQEFYLQLKNGKLKKKEEKVPINYSLIVVDEFQNYLADQIKIFQQLCKKNLSSMLYVGDMAQQTNLGTIRNWNEVSELISSDRSVVLQKVYRNTRKILQYIQSLGYNIFIPSEIREGVDVVKKTDLDYLGQLEYVKEIIKKSEQKSVGVLSKNREDLDIYKKEFINLDNVHFFSMSESQGVEFDIVIIVGINKEMFDLSFENKELLDEKNRINKDLLYVALTRAISELHIVGETALKTIFSE